eukprot:Opistho-2@45925
MTCLGVPFTITANSPESSSDKTGIIIGAVVGSVVFVSIVIVISLLRRMRSNKELDEWRIDSRDLMGDPDDRTNRSGSLASSADGLADKEERMGGRHVSTRSRTTAFNLELLYWHTNPVSIQRLVFRRPLADSTVARTIRSFRRFRHQNLVTFYGVCCDGNVPLGVITEFCHKGPLSAILYSRNITLGQSFFFSFALDIASGLDYLHRQNIVHTRFSSSTCLVDSRWIVK